jgi:hypothetical protein
MKSIELDQLGQPGNPYDKEFGAQISKEYKAYKEMRRRGELPDARRELESRRNSNPQFSFREDSEVKPR